MRYVAVDIETSGLSPKKDKIIEIGAVLYEDGVPKERFLSLVHPEIAGLKERITELTGITEEMLSDAPPESAVMREFLAFAGEEVLLGHNVLFDYSFLKVAAGRLSCPFERMGIDTLRLARRCLPELESKTLTAMCTHYGIETERSHRAYDDAAAAAALYERLAEEFLLKFPAEFEPQPLIFQEKKKEPVTEKQIRFLSAIIAYHKLELTPSYQDMTKSEASRLIDSLLLRYGRIPYVR